MNERERKEVARLQVLNVIEPKEMTHCGHYRCDWAAWHCYKRQTATTTRRVRGSKPNPVDHYCASGKCEVGRLIAEKLSVKVEGEKYRMAGMTLRRSKRPKAPRSTPKAERAPMKGAGECKADDCHRRIRRDNRSGVCWLCAQKAPWRWQLYGKKAS